MIRIINRLFLYVNAYYGGYAISTGNYALAGMAAAGILYCFWDGEIKS
jgi:hypothetical protein